MTTVVVFLGLAAAYTLGLITLVRAGRRSGRAQELARHQLMMSAVIRSLRAYEPHVAVAAFSCVAAAELEVYASGKSVRELIAEAQQASEEWGNEL